MDQVQRSGDTLQSGLIDKLGELLLQDASFFAIIIGLGAALLYSYLANPDLTTRQRRGRKFTLSWIVSSIVFLFYVSNEAIHRETIIAALAVGVLTMIVQAGGFVLIKAFFPKIAQALEPDQKKHDDRKLRKATTADLADPDKEIYTDATRLPGPEYEKRN